MDPHPEPPASLATCELPIKEIHGQWYRIHNSNREAIFFGKNRTNRFDCPNGDFGVFYVGETMAAAFIETFGQNTGFAFVQQTELSSRSLSIIASSRPLKLVDLTANGLAKIGADARLIAGDRALAGRWAAVLHSHDSQVDGLYYRARHDPSQCCAAIFERSGALLQLRSRSSLGDPAFESELLNLLSQYNFGLV